MDAGVDDPFCWDEARVIRELCTSNRTWDAPPATRLPDPDQLSAKLAELGVDGEALLTYEETVGTLKDLLVELGVKKIPHQLSIRRAIKQFQARSAKYQQWKKGDSGERLDDLDSGQIPESEIKDGKHASVQNQEATKGLSSASHSVVLNNNDGQGTSLAPTTGHSSPTNGQAAEDTSPPKKKQRIAPTNLTSLPTGAAFRPIPTEADVLSTSTPKKKQRVAPTNLTSLPTGAVFRPIPTEADVLVTTPPESDSGLSHSTPRFTYFGPRGLTFRDMFGPDRSAEQEYLTTEFSFAKTGSDFPGHHLQVNKAMKRYLLQHSTSGIANLASDSASDELLPLFGESEDEYDSDTWREFEKEEAEREKYEALKKSFLSKDEIDAVIRAAIAGYEGEWDQKKRPRQLLKANKLWNDARRHNSRLHLISLATERCRALDTRINKISKELRAQQWPNKEALEKHTEHLELSVGQRQAERLRIQILSSLVEPPKPHKLPRPTSRKKRPVEKEINDEDVITSDSDDGLEQFILDDDLEQVPVQEQFGTIPIEGSSGDMFQADPHDGQHLEEEIGGVAEVDPDGHLLSSADDFMDIDDDEGQEVNKDGIHPLPILNTIETASPNVVHNTPAAQLEELQTPLSEAVDYDLTQIEEIETPTRPRSLAKSAPLSSPPQSPLPFSLEQGNADDMVAIASQGVEYWASHSRSRDGFLIALLWKWPADLRDSLCTAVEGIGHEYLWKSYVETAKAEVEVGFQAVLRDTNARVASGLVQLYIAWTQHAVFGYPLKTTLDPNDIKLLEEIHTPQGFHEFHRKLQLVCRCFCTVPPTNSPVPHREAYSPDMSDLPRPIDELEDDTDTSDDLPLSRLPRAQRRKGGIIRNSEAADIRETNFQQRELFTERRRKLREEIAEVLPKDMAKFIINETKEGDEELIYVNERARRVIKEHQVEGVRFMWNQIVAKSKVRQGCLLAHTMGLGKTMQVITLLVAIAEASSSKMESVYKQIPEELRESRTLILCPSGLVDNWIDELNIWTPLKGPGGRPLADNEVGFLGTVYKIEAAIPKPQRWAGVLAWQKTGGVMVMGYPMFLQLAKDSQDVHDILLETPNIIIADEAHKLKGSSSQIHRVTQDFRARSRIAMTGSPLANNVADYYHMISWVAPNYLGPYPEFRQVYEMPVIAGLYADSSRADKRLAVKTLNVLKETVTPLVHRMGIQCLKSDLPQKKEFILYLGLTKLQLDTYSAYLQRIIWNSEVRDRMPKGMTSTWTFVNDLAVLLAHPWIFQRRLRRQKADRKALVEMAEDSETGSVISDDDGEEGDGAETETGEAAASNLNISESIKSELLATVSARDVESISHSWKVVLLNAILDECKRIGDKVLVFSQHLATLDFLEEMFRRQKRNWSRLDGSTKIAERHSAIKKFNDDGEAEVYLISTKAGGVGLNIYGANRVVIFDFKYVPMEEQQAVGRAYRIGQTKPVFVYWLILAETFEESVQNRSLFKMQLASRVVDKKNPSSRAKRAFDLFPKDGTLPTVPPRAPNISTYSGKDVVLDALLDSPDMGDNIRKIVMTETFEEEEPDDSILTTDDRKEIFEWIAKNHQRHANPQAAGPGYAAEQQMSLLGLPLSAAQPPQSYEPAKAGVQVPEHMRTNQPPASSLLNREVGAVPPLRPTGIAPSAATQISAQFSSSAAVNQHSLPSQVVANDPEMRPPREDVRSPVNELDGRMTLPSTPPPMVNIASGHAATVLTPRVHESRPRGQAAPIPGAGTQIRSPGVAKPILTPDQELQRIIDVKKRRIKDVLWAARQELGQELESSAQTPDEFFLELEAVLKNHPDHRQENIVTLDYHTSLASTMSTYPRFKHALLCGLVSAQDLGPMKREDITKLARTYDAMDEATFKQKLSQVSHDTSTQPVDASVRTSNSPAEISVHISREAERFDNRTRRVTMTKTTHQHPRVGGRAAAATPARVDRAVRGLGEVSLKLKRTKKRKPHLPDWAQAAVANGGAERSKPPQNVKLLTARTQSSRPRPPEPRPSRTRAGDSAEHALVID